MSKQDQTFQSDSLYGSPFWCAVSLGRDRDWLYQNLARLESAGFPKPDPVVGLYIKSDVIAWVKKRKNIQDDAIVVEQPPKKGVNYHAF